MGKFFNHYMPDRAVGFAHPYMIVAPKPGTTRSAIAATTWTWSATSRYGWSGFIRDARNCRSFGAARFKATIKRKRCSKQSGGLTLYFWRRRLFSGCWLGRACTIALCPLLMLWTAPPPAHECHGCGCC